MQTVANVIKPFFGIIKTTISIAFVIMSWKNADSGVNYAQKHFVILTTGANVIKHFTAISYEFLQ
jgi:hypothetical protein